MRNYIIWLLLVLLCSCDKENIEPSDHEKLCDVELGIFKLSEASLSFVPYILNDIITFVDSAGKNLILQVNFVNRTMDGQAVYYDYSSNGRDTVRYCYTFDAKYYRLKAETDNININISVKCNPSFIEPNSGKFSDILDIFVDDALNKNVAHQIYCDVIDFRNNHGFNYGNIVMSEVTFWDKKFNQVKYTDFAAPKYRLWYNNTEGIIAFTDHDGKLWRYHSKR